MTYLLPADPLAGAPDDLRAYLVTLPRLKPWAYVTLLSGNPYKTPSKRQPKKRVIIRDYDSPEGRDVAVPEAQQDFQSLMLQTRRAGWEIQDVHYLLWHWRSTVKGARWLWDQPGDGEFLFHRAWANAENYTRPRSKKAEYEVYDYIVEHVWAYIRRNPGKGTREMREDWGNLLPSLRGVKRAGAIAAARQRLLDDNLIEIVTQGRKAALYCTVDVDTGEIINHGITTAEINALLGWTSGPRRMPFRRVA